MGTPLLTATVHPLRRPCQPRRHRFFMPRRLTALVALACLACPPTAAQALELAALPTCPTATQHCLTLQVWLPPGDHQDWLTQQLQTANDRLAVIGAAVQVVQVHQLPANRLRIDRVAQRDDLGKLGSQTPLRWFVVDRLMDNAEPGRQRKGVTWRAGSQVWVIESQQAWRWVLAHELGHVLGLPHSTEAHSIMNKAPRAWPPPWQLGFTAKEQPLMRRTLAKVLKQGRIGRK